MEEQVRDLGSIVYKVLFLPKLDDKIKNCIRDKYFDDDDIFIPENMVRHYNLNVCEKVIREYNLDPTLVVNFVQFSKKCKELDIDYNLYLCSANFVVFLFIKPVKSWCLAGLIFN